MTDDAPGREPTLGERIRRRREELRIRQRDLAAAASVSAGYLSGLEHDAERATAPTLRRLALGLGQGRDALVDHAAREGRLAPRAGPRGVRDVDSVVRVPAAVPEPAPRPTPAKRWLTIAEAAAAMGLTEGTVRHLASDGRLAGARKVRVVGARGAPRWLVPAAAAVAHRSPSEGYAKPPRLEPPAGYVTMAAYAAAAGLSYGALHRRLEAGAVASVRVGRRRFIPVAELDRLAAG